MCKLKNSREKPKSHVVIRMEFKDAAEALIEACGHSQVLGILSDISKKEEQAAMDERIRSNYESTLPGR